MSAAAISRTMFSAPLILSKWVFPVNLSLPRSDEVATTEDVSRDLTLQEQRFLQGEAVGDEAERALQRLVDRAAAAPNGVFIASEVPDDE
jgi:hypothetical protein